MYTFKIVTNKILEIIFNLFFRYFTSWMLLFHFIYHLGINNFQYSLLLLSIFVSIFGFVISYIYPKFINVPIRTGTIIKPPPIPNIPASKPAITPRPLKIKTSFNIIKFITKRIF